MLLAGEEFLRRFTLHILPPGFRRMRHFGILSNSRKKAALAASAKICRGKKPPKLRCEKTEKPQSGGNKTPLRRPRPDGMPLLQNADDAQNRHGAAAATAARRAIAPLENGASVKSRTCFSAAPTELAGGAGGLCAGGKKTIQNQALAPILDSLQPLPKGQKQPTATSATAKKQSKIIENT